MFCQDTTGNDTHNAPQDMFEHEIYVLNPLGGPLTAVEGSDAPSSGPPLPPPGVPIIDDDGMGKDSLITSTKNSESNLSQKLIIMAKI